MPESYELWLNVLMIQSHGGQDQILIRYLWIPLKIPQKVPTIQFGFDTVKL